MFSSPRDCYDALSRYMAGFSNLSQGERTEKTLQWIRTQQDLCQDATPEIKAELQNMDKLFQGTTAAAEHPEDMVRLQEQLATVDGKPMMGVLIYRIAVDVYKEPSPTDIDAALVYGRVGILVRRALAAAMQQQFPEDHRNSDILLKMLLDEQVEPARQLAYKAGPLAVLSAHFGRSLMIDLLALQRNPQLLERMSSANQAGTEEIQQLFAAHGTLDLVCRDAAMLYRRNQASLMAPAEKNTPETKMEGHVLHARGTGIAEQAFLLELCHRMGL